MAEGPGFAQPRGWREAWCPAAQALTCHGRTATKTSFKYCTVTQQGFQPTLHSQHVHVNSSWGEQVYLWHLSVPGAGIQTNISYNLETATEPQIALKWAERAEQPLPGQDSLQIKSLASPPAFLVSLVLNKRWFLAQADLREHPSSPLPGWTALHRAPPYRVQKQQSIFPSCRLFNLPKLINLVLFHLLPVNKKWKKKNHHPSSCVTAHSKSLPAPERLAGRGWASSPPQNVSATLGQQWHATGQCCTARIIQVFSSVCCKTRITCGQMQTEKMLMSKGLSPPLCKAAWATTWFFYFRPSYTKSSLKSLQPSLNSASLEAVYAEQGEPELQKIHPILTTAPPLHSRSICHSS